MSFCKGIQNKIEKIMTIKFIFRCNFCNKNIRDLMKMVKEHGEFHHQCYLIKDYIDNNLTTQRSIVDFTKSVGYISFPLRLRAQKILVSDD